MRRDYNQSDQETAIEAVNVKKKFKSYKDKAYTIKERFVNPSRGKHENTMVLKGISFEVKRGEAVGIIGKNGCGKSTTLKLLTKILHPSEGQINIRGRVSSLIELGAGFHPDMTGRENIYTNASIFGITRKEVDARLNDIIRFSELEEYIDNPVRTYSSGMYMRLAFAVAINVDADVLLIDEILAVGDSSFQKKCFEKLNDIKKKGTTIVIVSHSMDQLYKICDRLIWLENGLIRDQGAPRFIGEAYLAAMEGRRLDRMTFEQQQKGEELAEEIKKAQLKEKTEREKTEKNQKQREAKLRAEKEKARLLELKKQQQTLEKNATLKSLTPFCCPEARREGNQKIKYKRVTVLNSEGKETNIFSTGERIIIQMDFENSIGRSRVNFTISITRTDWVYCYGSTTLMDTEKLIEIDKQGTVSLILEECRLLKGEYYIDLRIRDENDDCYENIFCLIKLVIKNRTDKEVGIFSMPHTWKVENHS